MNGVWLLVITYFIIAVVLVTIVLMLIQKSKINSIKKEVLELDKEKNLIASTPVLSELAKIETIIKNDKMEGKYKNWQYRFKVIKDKKLVKINDMLIDLDIMVDNHNYKDAKEQIARVGMEVYKVRNAANHLMGEIKEITVSEEKYRNIITKLKTKYRELSNEFQSHKSDYGEVENAIDLQFENIEKKFLDFEVVMEQNEYNEVVHVVKALDTMIDHMTIVIKEVPNLVLLALQLIPKKLEEIQTNYAEMIDEGYALDYLNIPYNVEEIMKNITAIMDRVKVLNLEECLFELKTVLEYLDSLFTDFENERLGKKLYEDNIEDFDKKLKRTNKIVGDIFIQMDDIMNMYDLTADDVKIIEDVRVRLLETSKAYEKLCLDAEEHIVPYSKLAKELELETNLLQQLEQDLDISLKSLGSMYDDEVRAKEQLDEIQVVLKQCKLRIRSYKLPIISNNYFVELAEANEAIGEIIKELEHKPTQIKILNTRVDTARDLVLKLFNTTNEMIRTAQLAEMAIVYGNRYRSELEEVDMGLTNAEKLFYKGNYKGALETGINATSLVEADIHQKLTNIYGKEI
ncbi:MAG: septation ring formation regulator EzrA [Bacilli bacterium]